MSEIWHWFGSNSSPRSTVSVLVRPCSALPSESCLLSPRGCDGCITCDGEARRAASDIGQYHPSGASMIAWLAVESGYGRNGTHCAAHDWLRGSAVFALRQDRGIRQEMVRGCGIPQARHLPIAEKRCRFARDCDPNTLPGSPNLPRADFKAPASLLGWDGGLGT